ncbi:MAG: hypothetical protein J6Y02_06405 [Pseudobutyrivibrio sp.]|nr:hypothetical protein [Pseudobutyrivibrio sp.]
MSVDIYTDLFNKNNDFRNYVEKYIFKHHITLEEALKHVMVRNYGDYILNMKGDNYEDSVSTQTRVTCGC